MTDLIDRGFSHQSDLKEALEIVRGSNAISRSRKLAEDFARESRESIAWIPDSHFKTALMELPEFVLSRLYWLLDQAAFSCSRTTFKLEI